MVDEVSPIVYKKMNIQNFLTEEEKKLENESENEEEEQEDNDIEENLIKVKPSQDFSKKVLDFIKLNDPKLFYDMVSKQVIYIGKTGIKVFNKNVTVLKKKIPLVLNPEKIFSIAVDKENNYMLIFMKKGEQRIILIVSLSNGMVIQYITGNLHQLLGMFFIFNSQSLNIKKRKETFFTLVYQDKIYYYKITFSEQKDQLDKVEFINQVNYPGYIKKFSYNQKFMILIIQRLDKQLIFDFYNLSNPKYYSKFFPFELPSIIKPSTALTINNNSTNENNSKEEIKKNDNSPVAPSFLDKMTNYFNAGNIPKDDLKKEPMINNKENYKENHFLLDSIYRKLYFIYVNYDISYVQFFKVKNLYNINKVYEIQFDSSHENTVQFIDNLILIHDFDSMTSRIIDLKCNALNKELFHKFPISSYDIIQKNKEIKEKENKSTSMLSYNNTGFYNKDLRLKGSVTQSAIHSIEEDNSECFNTNSPVLFFVLYNIYFDPLIYYTYSDSKFDALVNLTRRKHSKEVIINGLYEMIKSKKDIKLIRQIFKSIVKQIIKNHLKNNRAIRLNKFTEQKSEMLMSQLETFREPSELPIPFQYTIFKKRDLINQMDIYNKLFNTIENNSNLVKPEYAITIMLLFADELKLQKVPLHPQFNKILVSFLQKISNFFTANIYFQYFSFPDSLYLAKFLIYDIGLNKEGNYSQENRDEAIQHGLDMLKRLNKYNEIFKYFIQSNQLSKALIFYKNNKNNIINIKTINEEEMLVKEMMICNDGECDEKDENEPLGIIQKIEDFYLQEQDEQEEKIIKKYTQKNSGKE